jgi:hypothetical protein
VAVQFSLSYDANGDPVLVENTVQGTRKVVSTASVVSPYKSRFETATGGDPITDAEENQPDSNQSAIYDYIKEMEGGAADDINLSFIEKQNLERYTPEAIEASKKEPTTTGKVISTIFKAMVPNVDMATAAVKALSSFLPEESQEIKAIKQFYADPEQAALVESIPGMSNYNLVYGNPFDPSYGLSNAAQKRQNTIDKTLARKYGLTPEEIAQTKLGTYKGSVQTDLINRNKNLEDLKNKENNEKDRIRNQQINPTQNLTSQQKDYFRNGGGGGQDSGNQNNNNQSTTSAPTNVGNPFGFR